MRLEDQVCSLELAKRLKELDVKQESAFYWWKHKTNRSTVVSTSCHDGWEQICAAFTVAELGDFFPATIDNKYGDCTMWLNMRNTIGLNGKEHHVWYENMRQEETIIFSEKTEADARALMLIYLIENGLLAPGRDT